MKRKRSFLLPLTVLFSVVLLAITIDTPQEIITGFSQGKAEMISKYFKESVELTIENRENVYSSTQAEIILKDFFSDNTPQGFTILHEGGKEDSKYSIGNLQTNHGNYRVTILLKLNGTKPFIHQLRIEKDAS
jgi:hypothetical protein